jgi:hypothetical protein
MSDVFEDAVKAELKNELVLSNNGAVMHATTGKALLDLNFSVSSLRNASDADIVKKFTSAWFENPVLAVKWMFFARDIRGGMGERRLFRICFNWLAAQKPDAAKKLLKLVPEYGRWDDLWMSGLTGDVWSSVVDLIADAISSDLKKVDEGKPVSLLAKWLPSINTSSPKTKALASKIAFDLGMNERTYRKTLSKLRAASHVVEVDISANKWNEIDYNHVPSLANLKYKNAFERHDATRRRKWLEALKSGDTSVKINSSAAFPCDIVHKYESEHRSCRRRSFTEDIALEEMWKALPDYVAGESGRTLCVCDSSGSMTCPVGSGSISALDVCFSLGIYTSEKLSGPFKDKYISFSYSPKWIDMSNCKTLADKLSLSYSSAEVSNTDLEKTLKLVLDAAVNNNLKQEDLPSTILIISDMHFDYGVRGSKSKTLMSNIDQMYKDAGYTLPRIAWWNVTGSSTTVIPVQQMDNGCALVSGFSPTVMKMILSEKIDPFEALVDTLSTARYSSIEEAVKEVL